MVKSFSNINYSTLQICSLNLIDSKFKNKIKFNQNNFKINIFKIIKKIMKILIIKIIILFCFKIKDKTQKGEYKDLKQIYHQYTQLIIIIMIKIEKDHL